MTKLLIFFLVATVLLCASFGSAEPQAHQKPIRVAIVLYDGVQVLDVAGPLEVFTTSSIDTNGKSVPAFDVYMVSETLDPVKANNNGNVYIPKYALADAPAPEILIVPGGDTTRAESNSHLIDWIRKTSEKTEVTASVCTGAFLLAKAGLLNKKPATTHWYFLDRLTKEFPEIDVKREVRFVDSGKIVTSAGISAGIDMALHLVKRLYGQDTAQLTAKIMQYDGQNWMQ